MAKPLQQQPSDGTVANILNSNTTAAALGRAAPPHTPAGQSRTQPKPTGEPVNVAREFHLTASAARTLKKSVETFGDAVGPLTNSHFLRALLMVVQDALPYLEAEADKLH